MNEKFFCSFTKDDLDLIVYALQEAAQNDIDVAEDLPGYIKESIERARAQKLQALAAVINTAVENPNEDL